MLNVCVSRLACCFARSFGACLGSMKLARISHDWIAFHIYGMYSLFYSKSLLKMIKQNFHRRHFKVVFEKGKSRAPTVSTSEQAISHRHHLDLWREELTNSQRSDREPLPCKRGATSTLVFLASTISTRTTAAAATTAHRNRNLPQVGLQQPRMTTTPRCPAICSLSSDGRTTGEQR